MKAITFAAPIPTYLVTLAAGTLSPRLLVGAHACTRYREVPVPDLPGADWVRVRTRLGGICGSDLAVVSLQASPSTSPFSSFPFVLGHENVGTIEALGSGVHGFATGERVVVNPLLSCVPRGVVPVCPDCAAGRPSRCAHFTDGAVAPGMLTGTTRGLGGSWGERFVAHVSQLVRVPSSVADQAAVLVEPFACAVHAVRASMPAAGERVLVIGAGSIGLLTVAALRALAPEAEVTVAARHAFQCEHATRLGAARAVRGHEATRTALARLAGARLLATLIGPPAVVGGFDRTFLCIAGARGMDDALHLTRAGGTVVLLGNARGLDGIDWTPLWLKELMLHGSLTYGGAPGGVHGGAARGDFEEALAQIAGGGADLAPLVTHTFALADHTRALRTAMDKRARSVKVAFRFPDGGSS